MRFLLFSSAILALTVCLTIGQRAQTAQLRAERDTLAIRAAGLPDARTISARLAAGQVTAGELDRLRSDHAALGRLREELQSLQSLPPPSANPARPPDAIPVLTPGERRTLHEQNQAFPREILPRDAWRSNGRKLASDSLLSVFAAAREGDIAELAGLLELDEGNRKRAVTLFNSLPDAVQARYASPEAMVAGFMTQEVAPIASLQIASLGGFGSGSDAVRPYAIPRVVLARDATTVAPAETETVGFVLRYHEDGWRFVVPYAALEKYQRLVQAGRYPP